MKDNMWRFVIYLGIAQAILFLSHWAVFKTLSHFFDLARLEKTIWLRVIFIFLAISFLAASILSSRTFNILARLFYTFAATWLGFIYLFILATALVWLSWYFFKLAGFAPDKKWLAGIIFGLALALGVYGLINAARVRVTRIDVSLPNLPVAWQGKKIVWVSDTHLGHVSNLGFGREIAALVQAQDPAIIFIGGDLFDGMVGGSDAVVEPFSKMESEKGTFFITGNHEEFYDGTQFLDMVKRSGIMVLANEKTEIDGLQIVGVDYKATEKSQDFAHVLSKIELDQGKPSILLKHAPYDLAIAGNKGFSFQISGHTHLGQLFLFRFITRQVYHGYDYGLKKLGRMIVYTSSGAGTWGPPMRIDTKPEIVVITLK